MGLKLALAAVVILCCALAGRAVAAGSLRRSRALRQIMDGLQLLRIHMLDRSLPLPLALGQKDTKEPMVLHNKTSCIVLHNKDDAGGKNRTELLNKFHSLGNF